MLHCRSLLAAAALALATTGASAQAPLDVVASFSILGDMVGRVGGERVAVTTLVRPDGDAHVYQPTPADARALTAAHVVFVNGLDFEGWLDRLVEASGYAGPVIVASEGVEPLRIEEGHHDAEDAAHGHSAEAGHAAEAGHDDAAEYAETEAHGYDHGGVDPHAWQSVANARLYATNIAAALSAADPEGAAAFAANLDAYLAELDALDAEIRAAVDALPPERRVIVTSHDAFGYFGAAYGLAFLAPQGMSTEAEASAADVAALIRQLRAGGIPAVFVETVADPRLLEQIRSETGAAIGGALFSDALSGPDGPAPTYIDMMRHNLAQITGALGQ